MAKPLITTKPVSQLQAFAAQVSIVSGGLFAVLLLLLHVLEPEFDPTWRFVSEYMLGSFGWMMHLAFMALAISLLGALVAITSQVRIWYGYIGLVILGLSAVGLFIAGIFITDLATTRPEAMTFSGTMHVLGASLDYTPLAAILVSFALGRNQTWQPIRKWLLITAMITFVIMIAFIAVLPFDGKIGPGVLAGLVGRFLLLSYLGWIVTVGRHVLKLYRQKD